MNRAIDAAYVRAGVEAVYGRLDDRDWDHFWMSAAGDLTSFQRVLSGDATGGELVSDMLVLIGASRSYRRKPTSAGSGKTLADEFADDEDHAKARSAGQGDTPTRAGGDGFTWWRAEWLRYKALRQLIADEVAQTEPVRLFREVLLPEGLIRCEGIGKWLADHDREDVGMGVALRLLQSRLSEYFAARYEAVADAAKRKAATTGMGEWWAIMLAGDDGAKAREEDANRDARVPYIGGDEVPGVYCFEANRLLASILHVIWGELYRAFEIPGIDTVSLMLAGRAPDLNLYQSSFSVNENLPCLSRIKLELDPSLSPARVEKIYRAQRQKLRNRFQDSPKQILLPLLAFACREAGLPWGERMKVWNDFIRKNPALCERKARQGREDELPKEPGVYSEEKTFKHHCMRFRHRLLWPVFRGHGV